MHRAVDVGGRIVVFGGLAEAGHVLHDAAAYDPIKNAWRGHCSVSSGQSTKKELPMRRYVCSVENGRTIPRVVRRILVPVDFSDTSTAALEYAMDIAARHHAAVDVMHVWELPPYPAMAMYHDGDPKNDLVEGAPSFAQHVHELATAQLDDLISSASRPGVEVRGLLESGEPVRAIANAAPAYDLLVIGAHDDHGAKGLFFGNVGDRVAGEVSCPVVTVRAEHADTRRLRVSSASHP